MIGKHIQQLRKEKNISLSELAERAGVAKSYLSNIERDVQSNPSIQFLEKISGVLGVPMESLLHLSGYSASAVAAAAPEEDLDQEWLALIREAMETGISKEQFKEFLEFNKWKISQNKG